MSRMSDVYNSIVKLKRVLLGSADYCECMPLNVPSRDLVDAGLKPDRSLMDRQHNELEDVCR